MAQDQTSTTSASVAQDSATCSLRSWPRSIGRSAENRFRSRYFEHGGFNQVGKPVLSDVRLHSPHHRTRSGHQRILGAVATIQSRDEVLAPAATSVGAINMILRISEAFFGGLRR